MPFYKWSDMSRKNLAKPSDSEGSIIVGEHITLNQSVSQPGKVARLRTAELVDALVVVAHDGEAGGVVVHH